MLKSYDSYIFQNLSDFHLAKKELQLYEDSISVLGSIIRKYHFNDILGINLLHKHFDISNDEMLVRVFKDQSLATIQPVKAVGMNSAYVPYLWAYSAASGREIGWYPIEFVKWDDQYCADFELLHYVDDLLIELGEKLVEFNLQNIFGIAGIFSKSQFNIKADETIIETTDESNRELTLKVMPERIVNKMEDTTKTLWCFS